MLHGKSFVRFALAAALCSAGCTQNAQPVVLRSLEATGQFSSLCLGTKNDTATIPFWEPRNQQDCPDTSFADGETRHAFSMVTQTTRGEVALVDLTLGVVSDSEPTVPGYNFLTVGAQPTGIVSTPGSLATFVGVAEPGKEGIFALPTSCVVPRKTDAPLRDLTTWPACRLPSAPGEIALVIDATPGAGPGGYRQSCRPLMAMASEDGGQPMSAPPQTSACRADLSQETQQPGRRKLIVSLPDRTPSAPSKPDATVDPEITRGTIAIIDAQELLDREPGTYEPCIFEKEISLAPFVPDPRLDAARTQVEPDDLKAIPGMVTRLRHPEPPNKFDPKPAGFAQVDDETTKEHRLFVADLQAPVIHEIDTSDVCQPMEKKPLYPVSFADPTRIVTTTRVAASPLTIPLDGQPVTNGTRYLYAVDQFEGSVMAFDISPGSTNRTPLLRTHSALFPIEAPDRIAYASPARDVAFALRDHVAVDPATGAQQIGRFCNPDPSIPATDPGALYRPATDLSTGAAPAFLRGIFGFAALENGQVAVIDVQDFDAPCRRPIYPNPSKTENFRGCANDTVPHGGTFTTSTGPTVTDEVTCSTVETNRDRSNAAIRNDVTLGIHAPSLRAFPTLVSDTGRTLTTGGTADGLKNARMLGVDFSSRDKAEVWLGTTLYSTGDLANPLVIDPGHADSTSVVLSFVEPRIYAPQENFTAVYEGITSGAPRTSGQIKPFKGAWLELDDSGASFCDLGVQDEQLAQARAADYMVAPEDASDYGTQHADYIEITSDLFPSDDDKWWTKGFAGASCGGADPNVPQAGFLLCQTMFGTAASPSKNRDFHVVQAASKQLLVESRDPANDNEKFADLVACCFPSAFSYVVRASNEWVVRGSISGSQNDLETVVPATYTPNMVTGWVPDDKSACRISDDPLKSKLRSRALEVACSADDCAPNAMAQPTVAIADKPSPSNPKGQLGCVFPPEKFVRPPGNLPQPPALGDTTYGRCIFDGLKSNFVIYKGSSPSQKDYEYDWTVTGGFSPLSVNLSGTTDTNTSPLAMVYSPVRGALLVADGSSKGIVTVDLATLGIAIIY